MSNQKATIKEINDKFKDAFEFAKDNGCKVDSVFFYYGERMNGETKLHDVKVDYKSSIT